MIPEKIDRYVIKEKLGQGGMATVYRALDPRFKRDVAIKILPPAYLDNAIFKARFEREAQVIASLEYPGIVPVYDFGEDNGQPYLVMRYMPGGSLADRISQGPLKLDEIVRILNRLAPALDHFHTQGIVHRDLKPANILFDQYDTAYISDFGIARLSEGAVSLTGEALIGTPAYMSPEQAQGLRELDGRSDIYALGAILFEALTGKQPYEATTPMGVILKHITEPAPRLLAIKSDLPDELEVVITRSMEKNRDHRYSTASAMASDLNAVLEKTITGAPHEASSAQNPPETTGKRLTWPSPANNAQQAQAQKAEESSTVLEEETKKPKVEEKIVHPSEPSGPAGQQLAQNIYPAVPPFVIPENAKASSAQVAASGVSGVSAKPKALAKPKPKFSWAWIATSLIIAGMVCAIAFAGIWLVSNFLAPAPETTTLEGDPPTSVIEGDLEAETPTETNNNEFFFDDFSDPSSGWWDYEGDEGLMRYSSGSFNIQVEKPNWYLINTPGYYIEDANIEVEAYKSGGPDDNLIGLICRYQDSFNFYFFVIGSSGYYGIGKVLDGEPVLISNQENAFSSAINQGRTSNKLGADCIENKLTLYVNNTKIIEIVDDEFGAGDVGLFVGTFEIYGVNILFDNFKVTGYSPP